MSRLTVSTTIDAPPAQVWSVLEDVASHVEWMHDAVSIDFTSDRTSGVGTEFDCETRVGPFRLTDRMVVTRWEPGRAMGVRHVGLVTGDGTFLLSPRARGRRTRFRWRERLRFPWWMGGPLGALVARPVLRRVWRRNLRNLADVVSASDGVGRCQQLRRRSPHLRRRRRRQRAAGPSRP